MNTLTKTWPLKNVSAFTRHKNDAVVPAIHRKLIEDHFYAPEEFPPAEEITPGQIYALSVALNALQEPGKQTSYGYLRNDLRRGIDTYAGKTH